MDSIIRNAVGIFGEGDQFQLFAVRGETDGLVAEITEITVEELENKRNRLCVDLRNTNRVSPHGDAKPCRVSGYRGSLLEDLMINQREENLLVLINKHSNHIIILVGQGHEMFIETEF